MSFPEYGDSTADYFELDSRNKGNNPVKVTKGTSFAMATTVYDEFGNPFDLTDTELYFYVIDDVEKQLEDAVLLKKNFLAGGNLFEIAWNTVGQIIIFIRSSDTENLDGNNFYYSLLGTGVGFAEPKIFILKDEDFILLYDYFYSYEGYSVDKRRIAFYGYSDEKRYYEVPDFLCEDAVAMLEAGLELIQRGLSKTADKSHKNINLALTFFACDFLVKSGHSSQKSGLVTSESMGEMSVSYDSLSGRTKETLYGKDWFGLAMKQLQLYAMSKGLLYKKLTYIGLANYRSKLLEGTYTKERLDYKWGVR